MRSKLLLIIMIIFISSGYHAAAQGSFLKGMGKAILKEVTKSGSSNKSNSNNSAAQKEADTFRDAAKTPPQNSSQSDTQTRTVTRSRHPLTSKTCRDLTLIEQNDKHAYVLNNYIVYCIDFKNGTAWVKGPMVEKKGELEYADVHESLYFEGAVYPVTRFGVGAFAGEPLYSASIPYGVKEIQKNALAGTLIDSITVPGSVEFLGVQCFANSWIKKAVLEEGIKTIETGVFELCGKLEEIHLPASVEKTYIDVFSNCEALKSVTFAPGSRLKKIEKGMFYNCQKLSTIALPDGVQEIGSYAFSESGLKTITLPANLKKIGENAFANTPLVEIVIPGSVEEIASYAFFGCKNFKKITISSKFKDLRMLADIFGSDATYLFPDYNNLDNCPIFVWTE